MASVTQHGKAWRAKIRRKGYPHKSKTFRTKKQAEDWARKVEDEMVRGIYIDTDRQNEHTFAAACDYYNEHITPKLKRKSKRGQVNQLKRKLGHYTIKTLLPDYIFDYAVERLDAVSGETVRQDLSTIAMIYDSYCTLKRIPFVANPARVAKDMLKIKKVKLTSEQRDRRPTTEELEKLYGYKHKKHTLINLIVEFAVETAMRRGEIAKMKREHRIEPGLLSIPETKTDKPRTIPLSDRAKEILSSLPVRLDGFVWGVKPDSITQAFERMAKELKINDLVFHDLRHEGTSRFFEMGLTIPEVAEITGHSDWKSLKRYTKLSPHNIGKKMRGVS